MAMAPLSAEQLREELRYFARTAIREELTALKASLVNELYTNLDTEAPPSRKVAAEAFHGAAPGGEGPRASAGTPRQDGYTPLPPKRSSSRLLPQGVSDVLLGPGQPQTQETDATRSALERDIQALASVRYMGLQEGPENLESFGRDDARMSSEIQARCTALMHSHLFEMMSAWLVVLNAAWIGVSTDWVARNWTTEVPEWFHYTDWVFCIAAILELFIRIGAQGRYFFFEDHWKWNLFDTLVVLSQVADLGAGVFIRMDENGDQAIQGLRVLKLVRILRIARIASAFPELHILISSIVDSLQSLFWTMVLIFACLYGVAVVITQVVSDHKIAVGREEMEKSHEEMLHFFGSLDSTMVALYMVISEGIHWSELMNQLEDSLGSWVRLLFVAFTGFQLFAMMNIITACFVDSAMKIAAKAETQEVLDSLWGLLDENATLDVVTNEKLVTKDQFLSTYGHSSMRKFLDLINAHTEDPNQVFAMIDRDGDGTLTAPEFLICCERLMGPSKASMMVKIANEQRARSAVQDQALHDLTEKVQAKQNEILEVLSKLPGSRKP
mmetsp:Transcript_43151/g.100607  ORF Transcript_43151/g.100607 Transcript_43151/m.100607 type:complete len:556 (+) Transcript_43151:60-1727(+)